MGQSKQEIEENQTKPMQKKNQQRKETQQFTKHNPEN